MRPTIRQLADELGGLDILVNNAGIRRAPTVEERGHD